MMAHEDYKEMLVAQALTALDSGEARSLAVHLQDCSECRSDLSAWEATAVSLSFEPAVLAPSPELRNRIMEAIKADSVVPIQVNERAGTVRTQPSNVVPMLRRKAWSATQTSLAIAAGVLFVALGAALFVLWKQNTAARQELATLTSQVSEARQQLARQHEAMEIVGAPGARMSELAGTPEMPGAHAMIAYDQSGRAFLMAKGLPPAPAGKGYQLWFIKGGKPMPGKVFSTDSAGQGTLEDQIPPEALNSAVFAITLEPESGVPAPTGKVYLSSGS
ncbi:MAG: anti-sigma factor [Acidobacteriota bacterium]